MSALDDHVRAPVEAARQRVITDGVARISAEFPELAVRSDERGIVISGRGLWRRLFKDARLRAIRALWQ